MDIREVATAHQKYHKISINSVKKVFFAQRAKQTLVKGQIPPQELEVSPRSGLYLLVLLKEEISLGYIFFFGGRGWGGWAIIEFSLKDRRKNNMEGG